MRVLLLDGGDPGGGRWYAEELGRSLAARHEVTLLRGARAPVVPPGVTEDERDGLRIATLSWWSRSGFEAYRDPGPVELALTALERWRPEIAHVHGLRGLSTGLVFALRSRGVPVVVTLHDFWPVCPLGQLLNRRLEVCPGPAPERCRSCVGEQVAVRGAAARRLGARFPRLAPVARLLARASSGATRRLEARSAAMRQLLRTADAVIAPSRFLCERMAGLGVEGVSHVPLGLPAETLPEPSPGPAGRVRFAFFGSAIPSKGVHVLAAAYRRLDPGLAALHIHGGFPPYHGDPGYEGRIREILGSAAADALRGPYPRSDLSRRLADADVVVVPSLWEENAPLVVLEAQRARRPLIVSAHGGLVELVRHGVDGLHVPPGSVADLAEAMGRLLNAELRRALGTDPPPSPDLEGHAAALEEVYAGARRRYARRAGRVGVVVVDRGRPEAAAEAARSALDASLDPQIVVVENGTSPRPAPAGPWDVMALPVNRGYAAGVNAGLAALIERGCERLLFMNNDARLEPGCLRRLAEALEGEGLGAVGPVVLRDSDGRVESRGLRLDLAWGRHRLLGHGEARSEEERLVGVGAVSGAALMTTRVALGAAGMLNETFFHGFEDAEWCERLRRSGLAVAVHLGAAVRHRGGATLGQGAPAPLRYAARNHVLAVERLAPRRLGRRWARRLSIAALNITHALRQRRVPRAPALMAVVAGTRDGWRGTSGSLENA